MNCGQDVYKHTQHNDIMAKIGNNNPCPCGSGKKYKKSFVKKS
ncbi:MAG: SEC-C domain-containing protein [Candidatus Scalindua rubra]|nr:SEC-C domain-containing protein [Candidatus Scalindua rubra]